MIGTLWRFFFAICCFRKGPQDLPASREFLFLSLLGYGLGSFLLTLATQSADIAVASGLIDTALLATLCYIVLFFWRKPERWLQATTALYGTGIIFSIAAIPLSYWLARIGNDDPLVLLVFLFVISLLVWNIGVMAHIMRHALSSSFALGVLAALFYVWVITVTITSLFPQPDTPPM